MSSMQPIDLNWRNAYRQGYEQALEYLAKEHSLDELKRHAERLKKWGL